jgi:23S rRNA pseudouridine2605 synthase
VRVFSPGSDQPQKIAIDDLVYEDDVVELDGAPITPREAPVTLMLNKPPAVTSTLRDPLRQQDLTAFIAQMPAGVFPVGRLDRDTTGLLFCTNDGDLANAILHPDHHTEKVYWLWLNEVVPDNDPRLEQMQTGIPIRDYLARVSKLEVLHRSEHFTELLVTLREGKNRQIRRMCRALDFYLHHLHRRSVGPVSVGSLELGSFRELGADEVEALWEATGGRARCLERKLGALESRCQKQRANGTRALRLERWLSLHR